MNMTKSLSLIAIAAVTLTVAGCGGPAKEAAPDAGAPGTQAAADLKGTIRIDGSSTVYPISQAVAEEFMKENAGVSVTVNQSGTGGGFKKFAGGEIEICDASRPIKDKEAEELKAKNIEFIEIPVAYDGLSVVVNPSNTFATDLTVDELKKIWAPDSKINNWKDIRAGFPDLPLKLFGAGTDSGTFDYFTEAINGKSGASRSDYTGSEDDNVLVQGVTGEKGALGYFGYSYYIENKDKVKVVKVGGVEPSVETINGGTYQPLSRPIFIYVRKDALAKPEVKAFVAYYLGAKGRELVESVGYVRLPDELYALGQKHADEGKTGTVFGDGHTVGVKLADLMAKESK